MPLLHPSVSPHAERAVKRLDDLFDELLEKNLGLLRMIKVSLQIMVSAVYLTAREKLVTQLRTIDEHKTGT